MTKVTSLKEVFYPKSVAVVGASNSPPKIGYYVFSSVKGFHGNVYPVNPSVDYVQGMKAYRSLAELPEPVDLAIICIPAEKVPDVVEEAARVGVKGLVIISAGFREAEYHVGKRLQDRISQICRKTGIRIIGPNIFGIINLDYELNASFTPSFSQLRRGNISIVAQSGGVCHRILHIALDEGIGFNKIIHLGNRVDVDFPEVINYFTADENTDVIVVHIEGIERGKVLFEAVRRASKHKRIVMLKTGRSSVANKASLSHTGSIAGDYGIFRDIISQAGVTLVDDIYSLVDVAYAYSILKGKIIGNGGIAIVSFQAGIGIIASDIIESLGAKLARFSEETSRRIRDMLPPITHRDNPVDISFAALNIEILQDVLDAVLKDRNVSIALFTYAMPAQWQISPEYIGSISAKYDKPTIVGISTTTDNIKRLREEFEKYRVAYYPCPERAAKVASILYLEHRKGGVKGTI